MHRLARVACAWGLCVSAPLAAQDWAGFRGPDAGARAEASRLFVGLERPALVERWSASLGSGYAGAAVHGGRVFTAFAAGSEDVVAAFDERDGRELWRRTLDAAYKGHDGSHDGPIATPAADERAVFALSPRGVLLALAVRDGAPLWRVDLREIVGTEKPLYGHASSPLLAGPCVVLHHGIKDRQSISCFDRATGRVRWTAGRHEAAYQSPVLAELHGVAQVVAADGKALYGLAPEDGRVLWEAGFESDQSAVGAATAVPLVVEGDRVLVNHRGDSAALFQVGREGAAWKASLAWTSKGLRGSYNRPVYHDGHFYGYAGTLLTCVRATDGELLWRSRAPGDGFLTMVGGKLVVQTKLGAVHVGDVGSEGFREIARTQAMPDHSWTAVVYAGGHLYARGMSRLVKLGLTSAAMPERAALAVEALPLGPRFAAALAAVEQAQDKPAAVDALLAAAPALPWIEGDVVHFVYRGPGQDLGLVGEMIGARQQRAMTRVAGTDLFYWSTRVLPAARMTYRFVRDFDENLPDPRHERREKDGGGEWSWFAMPGWTEPGFFAAVDEAQRGRLVRHEVEGAKTEGRRVVDVWLPPGYDASESRYPVAYVHGGAEALEQGQLARALDGLAGGGRVRPLIVAFVSTLGTPQQAGAELLGDKRDAYADSVAEDVVALVDRTYRTRAERAARASVGAGRGGYAAAYAAFRRGDVFGRVSAQSLFGITVHVDALLGRLREAAALPAAAWLEWSRYDLRAEHEGWNVADNGKALAAELQRRGVPVRTREVVEGHSWGSWRNRADLVFGELFADLD
jgi:enterochelin esterase-like enzyme/outer membrane protein assembly factor BamB